jgi:hypothetical protein
LEKLILGILPEIFKLKKISKIFWRENFKTRKYLKISIFPWKVLRGKTLLNFLFFCIKFSNLEKLILGILPEIKKISKNFWRENFKTRKNLKIFNFPWKIVIGKIPCN